MRVLKAWGFGYLTSPSGVSPVPLSRKQPPLWTRASFIPNTKTCYQRVHPRFPTSGTGATWWLLWLTMSKSSSSIVVKAFTILSRTTTPTSILTRFTWMRSSKFPTLVGSVIPMRPWPLTTGWTGDVWWWPTPGTAARTAGQRSVCWKIPTSAIGATSTTCHSCFPYLVLSLTMTGPPCLRQSWLYRTTRAGRAQCSPPPASLGPFQIRITAIKFSRLCSTTNPTNGQR